MLDIFSLERKELLEISYQRAIRKEFVFTCAVVNCFAEALLL